LSRAARPKRIIDASSKRLGTHSREAPTSEHAPLGVCSVISRRQRQQGGPGFGHPVDAAQDLQVEHATADKPWPWFTRLQRVFAVDVLTCAKCQGPMALKKVAKTPKDIARVLAEVGLGPRPPPRPRPPLPGQLELELNLAG
jgi:hypothetical protein